MRYKVIHIHASGVIDMDDVYDTDDGRVELRSITARYIRIQDKPGSGHGPYEFGSFVIISEEHPAFNFDIWSDIGDETADDGVPNYLQDMRYAPFITDFIIKYFPSLYNYYLNQI